MLCLPLHCQVLQCLPPQRPFPWGGQRHVPIHRLGLSMQVDVSGTSPNQFGERISQLSQAHTRHCGQHRGPGR